MKNPQWNIRSSLERSTANISLGKERKDLKSILMSLATEETWAEIRQYFASVEAEDPLSVQQLE